MNLSVLNGKLGFCFKICKELGFCLENLAFGTKECFWPLKHFIKALANKGTYPNGYWSKGHTTTNLCNFFESWAEGQDLSGDPLMQLALDTCKDISQCLHKMYELDVWLSRPDAMEIADLGLQFLQGYKRLATQAFASGRALFPHMPKGHCLDHLFWQLKADLEIRDADFFINPLNHSVQINEDWVGKTSRLARRTAPAQVVSRVLERTLNAYYAHWRQEGFIFG